MKLNINALDSDDSDNEGGLGNVERVVMRPPGHSGYIMRPPEHSGYIMRPPGHSGYI